MAKVCNGGNEKLKFFTMIAVVIVVIDYLFSFISGDNFSFLLETLIPSIFSFGGGGFKLGFLYPLSVLLGAILIRWRYTKK
jgi:hypothetical protein